MFIHLCLVILSSLPLHYSDTAKAVKITHLFPVIDSAGQMQGHDTSVLKIFYYQNMSAWEMPVWMVKQNRYSYEYFVASNDSTHGLLYTQPTYSGIKQTRMSKANFINIESWTKHIYGYQAFQDNVMTLVSSVTEENGDLQEIYTGYSKKDSAGKGTCYYTYTNKMKDIPFSLSPELDSIKQMKLKRIRVLRHPTYIKEYKITMGEFDGIYTLEEIPVENNHEVFKYFARYKLASTQKGNAASR